jgi:hypothetical protein
MVYVFGESFVTVPRVVMEREGSGAVYCCG